jgi:hypothetical protein
MFYEKCFTLERRGGLMSRLAVAGFIVLVAASVSVTQESRPDSLEVIFKDGHEKTFALSDVSRIEFKKGAIVISQNGRPESITIADIAHMEFAGNARFAPGRNHFVGKWEVRTTQGGSKFFITLDADGKARKTEGSPNGTWTVVNGEARISWEDGWHDIIRRRGEKHQKVAFEPGKSFDDEPSNVTEATNTTPQPI